MNIRTTSLVQNNKLNEPQTARASLIAGILLSTRQLCFEDGSDEWIESLLGSFVCQCGTNPNFHTELCSFTKFVNQNLTGEQSLKLKNSICEDIQMTLKSMGLLPEVVVHRPHRLKAA